MSYLRNWYWTCISNGKNSNFHTQDDVKYKIFPGLPNSAVDIIGRMGFTCCSRTARDIIKMAGVDSDGMITKIVQFGKTAAEQRPTQLQLKEFLEELSREPYIYIGRNRIPHKLIYNSRFPPMILIG